MPMMRVTIHLEPTEREWFALLDEKRRQARALTESTERDFMVAATTAAAIRGLRPSSCGVLTDAGLVVEMDSQSPEGAAHGE